MVRHHDDRGTSLLLEDVGGAPGYAEYLDASGDPTHLEYENMRFWSPHSSIPTSSPRGCSRPAPAHCQKFGSRGVAARGSNRCQASIIKRAAELRLQSDYRSGAPSRQCRGEELQLVHFSRSEFLADGPQRLSCRFGTNPGKRAHARRLARDSCQPGACLSSTICLPM
ncbi:plasmid pRiA4b ORF-3 family protein [Bradyrhizobium arachidis]|uniref:plasmid pRiA4b ORF-3 family protein n=1 Tax=Bradyrhizobium arachidis TaxID=858423 RepID=UPI001FCE25FC|nr:plasmid pRiA4b ORF-3 family protein [Bradyrhizobium arachidis]